MDNLVYVSKPNYFVIIYITLLYVYSYTYMFISLLYIHIHIFKNGNDITSSLRLSRGE
jgi:hypothetical protein